MAERSLALVQKSFWSEIVGTVAYYVFLSPTLSSETRILFLLKILSFSLLLEYLIVSLIGFSKFVYLD